MGQEIAFAAIVKSADVMDDEADPATWRILSVTAKNMGLDGVNSVSGFYYQPEADTAQYVTRTAESVLYCYHTLDAAVAALARGKRCYGEYRGRIAQAERQLREHIVNRTQYVKSACATDGLNLAQAVEKI